MMLVHVYSTAFAANMCVPLNVENVCQPSFNSIFFINDDGILCLVYKGIKLMTRMGSRNREEVGSYGSGSSRTDARAEKKSMRCRRARGKWDANERESLA
jgi:hypothetical protein